MAEILDEEKNTEQEENVASAAEYMPGELAPQIITSAKIWKPDDLSGVDKTLTNVIQGLVMTCSVSDEAARRYHILQTWESRHMDRGYQYLQDDGRGGWTIAGTGGGTKNYTAAQDDANLYPTNIYSAQGDICTGALNRGKIKVSFFPKNSKNPQEVACADEANRYKYIWEKNNKELQRSVMELGWTDSRALTWTRSQADKSRFGVNDDDQPKIVEVTTCHGILESKLPMMVDTLQDCGYAMIFEEVDYAVARASYPWMGAKIKPSWGTYGELEFERIARINTRIGIVGKYITGTSGIREATMGYIWFRPGMYFDDKIPATQRDFLLKNFPDGIFVIMAGNELCCLWNESMDDHVSIGMFSRGFGQNRRSMGSSDIPIQKRINIWADLWDKFVRTAIPVTLLEVNAFNAEAVAQLEASPARFMNVALDEGQTMDMVVGQTPAPTPIQGMAEMFQWYVGPLIQSIDGGTPALFGGGEGEDNTVGATQIRLQQSLERYGSPWLMANYLFASCAKQAVKCCAENGNSEIYDNVPGQGNIAVNPANLKGNPDCEPETAGTIPESGAQREAKVMSILDMAQVNQQVAAVIGQPSNAREIVKALNLEDVLTFDEADSEDKQLEEIEVLLDSQPMLNPEYQQIQQQIQQIEPVHEQAKQVATELVQSGEQPPDQVFQQGEQIEQQLEQLKQQLQQTPEYQSSVPVAQDESEDHVTEAGTCFSWMQSPDGRAIRKAAGSEQPGGKNWNQWQNVYLHWQGHREMAAKLAASNQQPIPSKISINIPVDKLQGDSQVQALQKAGIQVTGPSDAPQEIEKETRIYTPVSEITTKTKRRL